MDECHESRSLLFRVAEGEAHPDEALQVARHLPSCTTCRILFAREVRLARVLESLDDAIPVDEAFLDDVMRALPDEPPRVARALKRRGLKLAGLAGALALSAAGAARLSQLVGAIEIRSPLAHLRPGDFEGFLATAASAARLASTLIDRMSAGLVVDLPPLQLGPAASIAALVPGVIAIAALSTLVVVFARCEPRA